MVEPPPARQEATSMIVLLNLPPQPISPAPLAPSLFKAQLQGAGLDTRLYNLNFEFARLVGTAPYEELARNFEVGKFGEWLFVPSAWGRNVGPSEDEFIQQHADDLSALRSVPNPVAWLRLLRSEIVPRFLEESCRRILADGVPRVAAFSCMFFQTSASLALGRLLKEAVPSIKLVYGGASFHSEMGDELIRKATWIDAVSTGEADDVIVPLLQSLLDGETPRDLQGVIARAPDGEIVVGRPHTPVSAAVLDAQPPPDYDDYYADAERLGFLEDPGFLDRVVLMFESSRGCWWGQKQNCTFCGLNAEGMTFRAKTQDKVYEELSHLSARYPMRQIQACDNILATEYWKSLLPRLKETPLRSNGHLLEIYYEIKPNLKRDQIRALGDAGITHVQPGFESMSSRLLDLMEKGVTGIQNVFVLKVCREYGIKVDWNYLLRVPGETAEDYLQQEGWLPYIFHFDPPKNIGPIQCERFSPYFERKGRWAENVRHETWYEAIYPSDIVDLDRVAYFFDCDWKDVLDPVTYVPLTRICTEWRRRWDDDRASLIDNDDPVRGFTVEDRRGREPVIFKLGRVEAAVYRGVRDIAAPRAVHRGLPEDLRAELTEAEVRGILLGLADHGLVLHENDRFLGLGLPPREDDVRLSADRVPVREIAGPRRAVNRGTARLPVIAR
ncbi:Radical SAM domain protein [Minicystis rosea]|nr:Radical SAM domain protein [Minicystis rosea]